MKGKEPPRFYRHHAAFSDSAGGTRETCVAVFYFIETMAKWRQKAAIESLTKKTVISLSTHIQGVRVHSTDNRANYPKQSSRQENLKHNAKHLNPNPS